MHPERRSTFAIDTRDGWVAGWTITAVGIAGAKAAAVGQEGAAPAMAADIAGWFGRDIAWTVAQEEDG